MMRMAWSAPLRNLLWLWLWCMLQWPVEPLSRPACQRQDPTRTPAASA